MGRLLQRLVFFREIVTRTVSRARRKNEHYLKILKSKNVMFIIKRMAVLDIRASRGFWTINDAEKQFDAIPQGRC